MLQEILVASVSTLIKQNLNASKPFEHPPIISSYC